VPVFGFLSAEAKICQKETTFASYNGIMELTDMESTEYFICLDLIRLLTLLQMTFSKAS